MSNQTPAVSILMPVHNGRPYLTDALDDLLAQTLSDFEFIIIDDASTDGSSAILKSYASDDDRIVLITNEENLGLPASLNKGLQRCRAPLVARADDDDRYAPDRLEKQVQYMEEHPDVGLLSSACHKIDADGERFATVLHHPTEDGPIRIRELFLNSLSHPGVMFRRDLVRRVGGYDPDYWTSEDADLYARLRPHTRMANLPEPLLAYRKHDTQMVQTRQSEGAKLSLSVRQRLLQEYLDSPLTLDETKAISDLYRGDPVPTADIDRARKRLWDVLERAKQQEAAETVTYYKHEISRALLRQSAYHVESDRAQSRVLLRDALRLDPRLALSLKTMRQAAKSYLPEAAVDVLRHVKSGVRNVWRTPLSDPTA